MIAYDVFLLAVCLSSYYATGSLYYSRERRERDRRSLGPPEVFAPFASGKACLPDLGFEFYRSGGSAKEGGSRCPESG